MNIVCLIPNNGTFLGKCLEVAEDMVSICYIKLIRNFVADLK